MINEKNIISQIKQGNENPLLEIYKLYRNEFIKWSIKNYKASEEQAKDSFQEAMIIFHQNIISGQLTELDTSLKTYLFQIGKFKVLNLQKKESRVVTYNDLVQVIKGNELNDYMEEEDKIYNKEQISKAIAKLPEDCQKVLKLYYFDEFDMESIARELNYKNADTAKSKKSICMKRLIEELKKLSMIFIF
ncbi:MAG: sigma-70 family RNA polymerase sigma factor [Flavobacteriia bacterium]|nr:sigma-70 family RNA polymerase sigma factor [Flavobacteriia bacterium]